jgi:hypothetical protein
VFVDRWCYVTHARWVIDCDRYAGLSDCALGEWYAKTRLAAVGQAVCSERGRTKDFLEVLFLVCDCLCDVVM